ncbi:hypothetical protein B0T25DRAFT_591549 [Lasiosphaeria hispida]|uniref:Transcriptional regulator n=1 Tax=Lasiosphaeria hispida TaxID=260671 RepID=A0AAJ0MBW6_9PEZI|nr:hypothetical protein B0T25DRAFT_591549 [Lasiosphaeria hispida]
MPPKKPSNKALEAELVKTVDQIYNSEDKDRLTVNHVRQLVENKLKLGEGFFKAGDWKAKSKQIIHNAIGEIENALLDAPSQVSPAPEPEPEPTPKAKPKNGANIKKRARKQTTPITSTGSELSELSELSDVSEAEKPAKKRKLAGRGKKPAVSDDEDEDDHENALTDTSDMEMKKESEIRSATKTGAPGPKAKGKGNTGKRASVPAVAIDSEIESPLSELTSEEPSVKSDLQETIISSGGASSKAKPPTKPLSGDESDESIIYDEPPKRKGKATKPKKAAGKAASPVPKPAAEDGEESDESVVYDETLKRKRKSQGVPAKTSKPKAAAKAAPELSSDDALIKQIQSQLVKCGVRKIWGVELKKYGDDKKARIRHLKNMLTEIGMTGRFSEARAREIKEQRELLADLDAVKEGEKSWGLSRGRSARRRGAKSFKESTDEEEDDSKGGGKAGENDGTGKSESGDDSDEDDAQPRARARAHVRADLAFLGDESDSD